MQLYFPGNSIFNKSELDHFKEILKSEGLYAQEWAHWTDTELQFNAENELEILKAKIVNQEVNAIMGKSIGSFFTCYAISKLNLNPKSVFLMGIPTGIDQWMLDYYQLALKNLKNAKIHILENENDPYSPIEEVKKLLIGIDYSLTLFPQADHIYMRAQEVATQLNLDQA